MGGPSHDEGVLRWHLDDDEREPVWVADGHLDQTTRLLLGLGVDCDATFGQALVGRVDVADLEHQADRRRGGVRVCSL